MNKRYPNLNGRNRGSINLGGMSIRRDIAPPPNTRSTKYPFYEMQVGDCLELEPSHPGARINRSGTCSAQGSAYSFARRHGVEFRSMIVKNDHDVPDGTIRIWRTA